MEDIGSSVCCQLTIKEKRMGTVKVEKLNQDEGKSAVKCAS